MTFPLADSRKRFSPGKFSFDFALGCLLALGTFVLYAQTLVPAVLDGDQGEFQFMLPALGIPHPTGFPLYVLLGHIWSWLPVGSLAYRINLFSAFFAALTVGALYLALARQNLHRLAALGGAVTLAVLPQFWQYATVAAVYRLHDFIIVLLFLFLAEWERTRRVAWLGAAGLTFGFDLANHLTILFFAPITGIFVILVAGRDLLKQVRSYLVCAGLVALPLVLYLYFPLSAAQLLSNQPVLPNWQR
ncbi:MAG: DUF2723 domain-containing protein, partial [Chloroflexota bacterium]|nr:DUF2723 domain-containing protein [Chloroflexota bacterium]